MSVLIVGSTALDSIKTPKAENPQTAGRLREPRGSCGQLFRTRANGRSGGRGFPEALRALYQRHGIDLQGLQRLRGKTFHWSGEYEANMNNRRTLLTELGVFETFNPTLPEEHQNTPYVLLANIAPALQSHVLDQMRRPKFVVADTMDLWLNIALQDLLKLFKRLDAFVLNDSEAHQLTEEETCLMPCARFTRWVPNT